MADEDPYLYPAHEIAPQIGLSTASQLVEDLYGLKVVHIEEMDSYIDKIYQVKVDPDHRNPHIESVSTKGYVLKVLNRIDSLKPHFDAEHKICRLLSRHGINCPIPELNIKGREQSLERLPKENNQPNGTEAMSMHMVRLMHFIPGVMLYDVPNTPEILVQSGDQLGRIANTIKDFKHPALDNYKLIWSLTCFPKLTKFLPAVTDQSKRQMVQDVIQAFKEEVEPNYDKFVEAVIQGDYSKHNIIVSSPIQSCDNNYNTPVSLVKGVVDFGHVMKNYRVMEVAIAIAYHSIDSDVVGPLDAGGYFLKGYYRHAELNHAEQQALKVLVTGRICQSVVIGTFTYLNNSANDYAITTAKKGWQVLETIWNTPKQELYARWQSIINGINTCVQEKQ